MPRELERLGYAPMSADDLTRLHIQGVSTAFVRELDEVGVARITADELIRLHQNGLSAADVRRAKARYPSAGVEEMIRLKRQGGI